MNKIQEVYLDNHPWTQRVWSQLVPAQALLAYVIGTNARKLRSYHYFVFNTYTLADWTTFSHLFAFSILSATPVLDYIPISEVLTFTRGQTRGESLCVPIVIVEDVFVESEETFDLMLVPTPEDFFKVLFVPGRDVSTVVISDGANNRSMQW